jgi:hypothetical protein
MPELPLTDDTQHLPEHGINECIKNQRRLMEQAG